MGEAFLIQQGEMVEPEPPIPEGSLYYEGDEVTGITGEWVTGIVGSESSLIKNTDHLYASANGTNADFEQRMALWTTDNTIDLTNIDTLFITWKNTGNASTANRSYFIAGGLKNGNTGSFGVRLEKESTFTLVEDSIDVSGLTGNHYVRCGCRDASSNENSNAKVEIYAIRGV